MNPVTTDQSLPVHVLKTSIGIVIEGTIDPVTLQWTCCWSPPPPYSRKKMKRIWREYIPWRNNIMEEEARRAGRRIMVVTPGMNGEMTMAVFGDERRAE